LYLFIKELIAIAYATYKSSLIEKWQAWESIYGIMHFLHLASNSIIGIVSGVARVSCALEQEIFLRPTSTKLTEFELKNWCKSPEEAKAELCCCYLFLFLRLGAEPPAAGGKRGFGGGAPDAETIFCCFFFSKNTHF